MDAAGAITHYVMDGDRPLTAETDGKITFYLFGLGAIGEKTTTWAYSLPDGSNTPRQLTDASGEVTLAVRYDPWGDTLETYGTGNFQFGYFGGIMDTATGLLYVGNSQYYDPETGRFLTRDARPGQNNPYTPVDPTGGLLVPLMLLSLVYARKKSRGKWDTLVILLVLGVSVGMSLAACGSPGTPKPETLNLHITVTPTATKVQATTGAGQDLGTHATSTEFPADSPTLCVELTVTLTRTPTPGLTQPTRPVGLGPAYDDVWMTYSNLWNKQDEEAWWWKDGNVRRFTPLDFMDRLLQFELQGAKHGYSDKLPELAIGNFCFWTTRTSDSDWTQARACHGNPTDLEIFEYIGRRGILVSGLNSESGLTKDYRVRTDSDYEKWIKWPGDHNHDYEVPYSDYFIATPAAWLDWRNVANDGAGNDVPVEWGNNVDDFNSGLFLNVKNKRKPGEIGRKTNQVFLEVQNNLYAFTYCQYVYYNNPTPNAGVDNTAHCGDTSHWSP